MTDGSIAVYSKQGELMCRTCESAATLDEGYMRAARGSCMGALSTGVVSLFFNPFYIFSIAAIVQGIRAIVLINRPEYRSVLGTRRGGLMAAAIVGMLTGALRPFVLLGAIVGVISAR
jgi:hypothetical protein